jgi:hypothetical protein
MERDRMVVPTPAEVLDYARHLGVRRTALRAAYVAANRVVPLSVFQCVRLSPADVNAALAAPDGAFEGRFLDPGSLERQAGTLDPAARRVIRGALDRDDACYAVFDGDRLANVGFYATRPTPVLNDLVVHFDPRHRYMHGAYTPPGYRGHRLHALGVLGAARALFAAGVPALVGVYERTNYRSMVSALRMGWVPCGTLYRVGTGRWMRLGRTAAAAALGMHLETRRDEVAA